MIVLGIESSCDETAAALVTDQGRVLASAVASQLELHAPFGGVVPELASRQHLRDLPHLVERVLSEAQLDWPQVEGIAATCGPGLVGALLVGLGWAKAAAWARGLPFIGVNHLEGHLAALELEGVTVPRPFLGLVASGGHTSLFRVSGVGIPQVQLLAATRDDAVGEAFDKVAKLLGLGYPGGPAIERAVGDRSASFTFTLPRLKDGSLGFSYSGLKTAVRYHLEEQKKAGRRVDPVEVAAAFQATLVQDLANKTRTALERFPVQALALTGGVAANRRLRAALAKVAQEAGLPFFCPPIHWCTDNAAMIALAGRRRLQAGERSPWNLGAAAQLALGAEGPHGV